MDMGSGYTPPFSPVAPRKVRVNFDTPTRLCNILGVGRQLAQAIVLVRENTGNLVPYTLGTIIGRPLTLRDQSGLLGQFRHNGDRLSDVFGGRICLTPLGGRYYTENIVRVTHH
ncbi:hypothetical protein DPMN_103785 [Dreissena polymorpha]|uniref:Uncharacterized protein n=1 Tax=Dreissena polymorpha TaxID=45954 RepID=A0A9D4K0I3_DREPO|nr:hypothetical protein DPMN_103785 [Dreissena polymorpha]